MEVVVESMIFMDHLLRITIDLLLASNHLFGLCSLPKSILEPASQSLHVSHTSSANSSPALGLLSPVKVSHFLGGVSA